MPTISIINRSSVMTDKEVDKITGALQKQVTDRAGREPHLRLRGLRSLRVG